MTRYMCIYVSKGSCPRINLGTFRAVCLIRFVANVGLECGSLVWKTEDIPYPYIETWEDKEPETMGSILFTPDWPWACHEIKTLNPKPSTQDHEA